MSPRSIKMISGVYYSAKATTIDVHGRMKKALSKNTRKNRKNFRNFRIKSSLEFIEG